MVPELMRLHITPFYVDLLEAVLGPRLIDSASNISYHIIQTFPENNYGYVDLPRMEGEKIRKKLNGTILKGKKIRVEEARPKKRRHVDEQEPDVRVKEPKVKKAKTSKTEHNVIAGQEMPGGRKVKRGWTEAKPAKSSKKDKSKAASRSKYTDQEELLFRTKVPPNRSDVDETSRPAKAKSKKNKGERAVHEFEKSTKQPSFLKQDIGLGIKGNLEFVEGRGWVDEAGEVVEKETDGSAERREKAGLRPRPKRISANEAEQPPETSMPLSDDTQSNGPDQQSQAISDPSIDDTSSSGSSSASDSENEVDDQAEPYETPEVHPLEELFKKPNKPTSQDIAKPSLEISTAFSFFDSEDAADLEDEPIIPLTPFSSQEFCSRGLRSAAPTPDTAHPSRFNSYGSSGLPGDEDIEEDAGQAPSKKPSAEAPSRGQSEFEKKFWENRADNNRAWKLRRRTVLKEKRQRENKARRPKNW